MFSYNFFFIAFILTLPLVLVNILLCFWLFFDYFLTIFMQNDGAKTPAYGKAFTFGGN